MKDIITKLSKLIEVKKIIALTMTFIFCILAIRGDIPVDKTMLIITMIMTYYFTASVEKERLNK